MKSDNAKSRPRDVLAGMLPFDEDGRALWSVDELQGALRQHLRRPLASLAERLDPPGLSVATQQEALEGTIGELLLHNPAPSVQTLRALKSFAKREVSDPRAAIPADISLLLYYGSIIAARVRRNERISRLSDDDLRRGLNWAVRQLWIDPATRDLFLQGLSHLRSPRSRWRHQ